MDDHGKLPALAFAVTAMLISLAWYGSGELIDDAFISFRYARNWVDGNGLVFNLGERVEGYTNFLWVALIALGLKAGIAAEVASRCLGVLTALATLLLTADCAARVIPSDGRARMLPVLALAISPVFNLWAMHGLETPLFAVLVLAGFWSEVRALEAERASYLAPMFFGLAALTRPEGVLLALATLSAAAAMTPRRRFVDVAARVGILFAFVIPHLLWRLHYYGDIVPNTFYAKVESRSESLGHGLAYLADFFTTGGGLMFALLVPAALTLSRRRSILLASALFAVAVMAVGLEGGDYYPGFRFLAPILPIGYLLAGAGAAAILESLQQRGVRRAMGSLLVLALVAQHLLAGWLGAERERAGANSFTALMRVVGLELKRSVPPETTIALNPAGAVPYYSGLTAIDMIGLTDRHIGRAGHWSDDGDTRGDGAYVLGRRPDLILIGNVLVFRPGVPENEILARPWPAILQSEREIAATGDLTSRYRREILRLPDGSCLAFLRRIEAVPP